MSIKASHFIIICSVLLFSSSIQATSYDDEKKIKEAAELMHQIDDYQRNKDKWYYQDTRKMEKPNWFTNILCCVGAIIVMGAIGAARDQSKEAKSGAKQEKTKKQDDWFDIEMKRRGEIFAKQAKEEKKIIVSNLIKCPDCGKDVSKRAKACPNCGCPMV